MEERYFSKPYRRKPPHRKIVRRYSPIKKPRMLRNSVELKSFKDFMKESKDS